MSIINSGDYGQPCLLPINGAPCTTKNIHLSKPDTGTTNGLRYGTQFVVPVREELVTDSVPGDG